MKLLIITYTFSDKSPAGQVFSAIINEFSEFEDVDITAVSTPSDNLKKSINHIKIENKFQLGERFQKILMLFTGVAFENFFWVLKVEKAISKLLRQQSFDYIISFVNGNKPEILNLGHQFSLKYKIPLCVHMVDPLPPPKHWGLFPPYRNKLRNYIKPGLKYAKLISMGNQRMLEFQDSLYEFDLLSKSFVVPDAVGGTFNWYGDPKNYSKKTVFIFLGSFYGMRKPDVLFEGFQLFLEEGNNAELHLYGDSKINLSSFKLNDCTKSNIKFFPFTSNVEEVVKKSSLLIDVDVPYSGNVFSSSKIKRYLFNDRVILCVTNNDSPSFDLCNELPNSCIATSSDANQVAAALKKVLEIKYHESVFEERLKIIERFKADNISKMIYNKLKSISYDKK